MWVTRGRRGQHRPGTGPRRAGVGREPRSQQRRPALHPARRRVRQHCCRVHSRV
jgi:hypothetical protein